MDAIETFTDEQTGITASVEYDPFDNESPRDFDGNVWTLIGFNNPHRTFGDEEIDIDQLIEYEEIEVADESVNGNSKVDLIGYLREHYDAHLIVPVQCYDHSMVSYYAGKPVTEHWDTGTAGVAVLTKAELDKEFDGDVDKARSNLDGELETFTDWANGTIYAYVVQSADGETLDSLCGMYGFGYACEEAKTALKDAVDAAHAESAEVAYWLSREVVTV